MTLPRTSQPIAVPQTAGNPQGWLLLEPGHSPWQWRRFARRRTPASDQVLPIWHVRPRAIPRLLCRKAESASKARQLHLNNAGWLASACRAEDVGSRNTIHAIRVPLAPSRFDGLLGATSHLGWVLGGLALTAHWYRAGMRLSYSYPPSNASIPHVPGKIRISPNRFPYSGFQKILQ